MHQSRYPSADHPGLAPIVRRFFEEAGSRPDRACFGIACPVVGDDCSAPNLPWTINARALAAEIGIPRTAIINDFVAVGYGIELLAPADLATLQEGTPAPQGPIALIGAGTGLGQGFLIWQGDHYRVLAIRGRAQRLRAERRGAGRPASSRCASSSGGSPGSGCSRGRGSPTSTSTCARPAWRRSSRRCGPSWTRRTTGR